MCDFFKHDDLEMYTESVLSYIRFCIECPVDKSIRVTQQTLDDWPCANAPSSPGLCFRSRGKQLYNAGRADLMRGIRNATAAHKRKTEIHFSDNNPRQVWHGIQSITNYRRRVVTSGSSDMPQAEELNSFFAQLEVI